MINIKLVIKFSIACLLLLSLSSCNSESQISVLKKCSTLAEESILYSRANYVKLFHHFNPKKFEKTFQQVRDFDHVTHRNTINTYRIAVRKIKTKDTVTKNLIASCEELAKFSTNFIDQTYPRAVAHKSEFNSLTDQFFIEINLIVKFDHNIGVFERNSQSFKHLVQKYEDAHNVFIKNFNAELQSK